MFLEINQHFNMHAIKACNVKIQNNAFVVEWCCNLNSDTFFIDLLKFSNSVL